MENWNWEDVEIELKEPTEDEREEYWKKPEPISLFGGEAWKTSHWNGGRVPTPL